MKSSYLIGNTSITVCHKGQTYQGDYPANKKKFIKLLLDGQYEKALAMVNTKRSLEYASGNKLSLTEAGSIVLKKSEEPLPDALSKIIEDFTQQKRPVDGFLAFWKRLKENPSEDSRKELFDFLRHLDLKITDDGKIVAYKGVTENFKDCHTETFDNTPGRVHTIPRKNVDSDRRNSCSFGFHVGSWEYASTFGKETVEVLVDPKDVVAVPQDSACQKMRVCRYRVLRVVTKMTYAEILKTGKLHSEKPASDSEKKSVVITSGDWIIKRVTGGRIWIPKEPLESAGFSPNSEIFVYIEKSQIIIAKKSSKMDPDFILRTNRDLNVRIAKSILNSIHTGKSFRIKILSEGRISIMKG